MFAINKIWMILILLFYPTFITSLAWFIHAIIEDDVFYPELWEKEVGVVYNVLMICIIFVQWVKYLIKFGEFL